MTNRRAFRMALASRGFGLETVRIGIGPHQRGDLHALATHHLHQVAQDAEGGHHRNGLGGMAG